MTLFRIKDWAKFYEIADAKKIVGPMSWVPIRTKTDGLGYSRITLQDDRCCLLAAWYLMVGVAAKQPREDRGKLIRDGIPLNAADLSAMTRFPSEVFERALVFFSDPRQGWLEKEHVPGNLRASPDESGDSGVIAGKLGPTGQDRTGQDRTIAPGEKPPVAVKHRERDPLFDTLAEIEGSDLKQLSPKAGARIGTALADIRTVAPNLTPEEIRRRAGFYRSLYPGAALTANALAAHWAKCDGKSPVVSSQRHIPMANDPDLFKREAQT